ncbi:hypothetical protein KAI87_12115, partial [Myxococcota bacterium]|nr:hypothetical protein [Myxococcota bacterium]
MDAAVHAQQMTVGTDAAMQHTNASLISLRATMSAASGARAAWIVAQWFLAVIQRKTNAKAQS